MNVEQDLSDLSEDVTSDEEISDDVDSGIDEKEEEGGDERFDMEGAPPKKKAKLSRTELYKPPTSDEINQLKETENLFQSSLFRMQITELLGEVQLKPKRKRQIDEYIKQLTESLKALPSFKDRDLTDQKWVAKKGLQVPIRQVPYNVKGKFKFTPPTNVHVVGSYALGTCIKPNVSVDLAVEIPKECMENKDYLNHRYFRKRALYLTFIASHIQKYEIVENVEFTYHNGNHIKPILVVIPAGNLGKHCKVHIHVTPAEGTFKLNRFHVKKNSVRKQWYHDTGSSEQDNETNQAATPNYNTAVLQDMIHCKHTEHVLQHIQDSQGVRDGIVLLKVWLHQRELDTGRGAMSSLLITSYVAYLLSCKKLNRMMSSYQIMRNTLLHLSQASWNAEPISLATFSAPDDLRPNMDDFLSVFDVVFLDGTGYANLAADMSVATLHVIKHEAELAVQYLETPGLDGFDVLFMRRMSFLCKVDQLIHISQISQLKESVKKMNLEAELLDHYGDYVQTCTHKLIKLLDKAIGRRVRLIYHKSSPTKQWSIKESPPQLDSQDRITIGFVMNPDTYATIVERGPPADSDEAKEFQAFWGDLSELRRFQDGSICEAVVWSGTTLSQKRLITGKAIRHVLKRHADIPREALTYLAGQLDRVLKLPQKGKKYLPYGTGEEQHSMVIKTYDALSKQLRNMEDFPLAVHSIQGTSPVFRFAEVFPAIPATWTQHDNVEGQRQVPVSTEMCPPYVPSMKVVCILETSGKWPEEADAVKRLKAAFHIKLGEILTKKYKLTNSVFPTHVDVLKDGYVFRVVIGYIKEISLLKLVTTPDGMVRNVETEEALALERELVTLPKLSTTLLSIHQLYPSCSSTVRLAKRWISAQMLDHFIQDEAVEIIVSHLFLHPAPYNVTTSPQTGFLRFLKLLATHDWKTVPLIVNLNRELTKKDYGDIERLFAKNRTTLPLMFIATPYDKYNSVWTKKKPTAPILQRFALLAKQSFDVLENQFNETKVDLDFKLVFRPPLETFDVIIHLKCDKLAREHQAVDITEETNCPKYKMPADIEDLQPMPVYDFDPAQLYYQELQDSYDKHALFFHDTYGGNLIGVLWKPAAFQPQSFKTSSVECAMVKPDSGGKDVQLVPNTEAIIEDFKIIGAGIVQTIETKTEKWKI